MAEVLYADSFFEEMAQVETKRVRDNVMEATELLAVIPEMGSPNIPSMSKSKHATKVGVVGSNPVIATT